MEEVATILDFEKVFVPVTFVTFSHRNTWAIPIAVFCFCFLVCMGMEEDVRGQEEVQQ
jgi:hypothetical protein